jgi:hypothetical protein
MVLEGVNWIYVDQDRDRWRAFTNTVMKLGVPQKVERLSWPAELTISFSTRVLLQVI